MYLIQLTDNYKKVCVPCVPSCVPFSIMVHIRKPCPSMLLPLCVPCLPFTRMRVREKIFHSAYQPKTYCSNFICNEKFSRTHGNNGTHHTHVHKPYSPNASICVPFFQWYTRKIKITNKVISNQYFKCVYLLLVVTILTAFH